MSLSDKIIIMNGGVVEQMGTPQETYYSPKSAFVADFIGEANFLEGVVEKHDVMKIADVSVPVKTGDMAAGTACRLVLRPESVTLKDTGYSSMQSRIFLLYGLLPELSCTGQRYACEAGRI